MNREETEAVVIKILRTILKCEVGPESTQRNTPLWDSLKHISLVFAIEDAFNIEFTDDDLVNLNSVKSIVEKIVMQNEA